MKITQARTPHTSTPGDVSNLQIPGCIKGGGGGRGEGGERSCSMTNASCGDGSAPGHSEEKRKKETNYEVKRVREGKKKIKNCLTGRNWTNGRECCLASTPGREKVDRTNKNNFCFVLTFTTRLISNLMRNYEQKSKPVLHSGPSYLLVMS